MLPPLNLSEADAREALQRLEKTFAAARQQAKETA